MGTVFSVIPSLTSPIFSDFSFGRIRFLPGLRFEGLCLDVSLISVSPHPPLPWPRVVSVSPPPAPAPFCLCHPPSGPPHSHRQQGVPARIRCRWFSGYSVRRRLRWAWWHCRPHGLKLLLSAWFPLASSTREETGVLRWNSDLRSAAGLRRGKRTTVRAAVARGLGEGARPWDGALLGWALTRTVPGCSPRCLQGLGVPVLPHSGPGHQIGPHCGPGRAFLRTPEELIRACHHLCHHRRGLSGLNSLVSDLDSSCTIEVMRCGDSDPAWNQKAGDLGCECALSLFP